MPTAPAQSLGDPWWGPSDRTKPTDGFAVRVPVTVENKFDYVLMDPYVAVELDFADLLVRAGWTNQTIGAELRLRGFTLDVDSIRVIPYNRGFVTGPIEGGAQQPIAHVFYPALLEAAKYREFDPARAPGGTVMFQIEGSLAPQQKRDFYIYANPVEYGEREPHKHTDPTARGALDSYLWGTTGTVTYGWEPNQPGQRHLLQIRSLATGQNPVTVSTFELGRYVPIPTSSTYPNPFTLQPGETRPFLVPANKAYKIESQRPVEVTAVGQNSQGGTSSYESMGYYPGDSGSFADDSFTIWVAGDQRNAWHFVKASPGTVTISANGNLGAVQTVTLNSANPSVSVSAPAASARLVRFTSTDGKFLVFTGQPHSGGDDVLTIPFPAHQIPATSGGPSGTQFFTYVMPDQGYIRVCPEANATVRIVDTEGAQLQLYPDGPVATTPPAFFEAKTFCDEIPVPRTANGASHHEFYAAPPSIAPFRVMVGSGDRPSLDSSMLNYTRPLLGPYGGLAGVDYDLYGRAGIFGHYNGTRITIFEEKIRADQSTFTVNRTRGLQRDEFVPLLPGPDSTGRWHVTSNKPISASSLESATYLERDQDTEQHYDSAIPYLFHIPGRPVMPHVTIGEADFRGPLVDLRSPATPFLTTGPASPVSFRLDLVNLGRWINGEDLADTFTVSCSSPAGWDVDGCAKEVTLGSRSSERLNIVITPSADDVNITRSIIVEARSKLGAVATFKISVHVEIRYGVGLWFDVEGGRKTIDPPIGLDPADTHSYTIVLKNTGSTQDSFALSVDEPREGWTQDLLLDGDPVTNVRLEGGESVLLEFRVKAPNAETAQQNIVSIVAQSASSALAADVVNTATRIRPKVDLELILEPQTRLAEPNETVLFNISTRNKGNDVFTVIFEQDSILPDGWTAELSVPEITLNPNPSNDPTLNYVLQLRVTPPEGARAGDLASVKLAAEVDTGGGRVPGDEISAVVVVRRVYDLRTPPVADAEALPGETLGFVLPITNHGNGQVRLELLPGAVEAALVTPDGDSTIVDDWGVGLDVATLTLDLNETAELPLRVDVPNGTAPGLYNITFTTRLSREAFQNLTLPVQVRTLSRVEFGGPTSVALIPGRPMTLGYVARNTGNVEGSFDLRANVPEGWNGTVSPDRARLAPGASIPVTFTLNATRDAPDAAYVARLEAQALPAAATPTDVRIRVARPQLFLDGVTSTGDLRAGELILVSAAVGNAGSIDATNVSVALMVDGEVVDRVLLARVPVGSSAQATLSWVATQRGGDVRIVLDPDQEISLASREDTEAEVEFGSRIGVPAPGLVGILAVVAAVAATVAKRHSGVPEKKSSAPAVEASLPGHLLVSERDEE